MDKIINNFMEKFENEDLFIEATPEQINRLKELWGNGAGAVIDFYSKYQPYEIPMTESYVQLLDIDRMIMESTNAEPGKYLAEYGVYVFAVTVGGNVLCIDTNDIHNGVPSVRIADSGFCDFNEFYECAEIGIVPEEVMDEFPEDEMIPLNYENIALCMKKIEDSFFDFMLKLSNDEYEDIEEYLE